MLRILLFLLITISISYISNAQETRGKETPEKPLPVNSSSIPGFRKQSSAITVNEKKNVHIDAGRSVESDRKIVVTGNSAEISGILKTDYNNMSPTVQSKINQNKATGKNLLDGVEKGFTVQIKSCATDSDHKRILSFMSVNKQFIRTEFVSAGLVKIIVEPTFDSVDLKESMSTHNISFNFLNRFYLLKK
ncbi:MAG: hypothetical protein ABIO04_11105 [Ferruginibacter sp.]